MGGRRLRPGAWGVRCSFAWYCQRVLRTSERIAGLGEQECPRGSKSPAPSACGGAETPAGAAAEAKDAVRRVGLAPRGLLAFSLKKGRHTCGRILFRFDLLVGCMGASIVKPQVCVLDYKVGASRCDFETAHVHFSHLEFGLGTPQPASKSEGR